MGQGFYSLANMCYAVAFLSDKIELVETEIEHKIVSLIYQEGTYGTSAGIACFRVCEVVFTWTAIVIA